jgi:hypothetical protein
VPPAGWQPDPSWPPAPHGWQFWVEDGASAPSSEPKKGFLAARREAKVHERYEHELAEWTEDDDELASCIEAAKSFDGFEPSAVSGFVLKAGERPFLLIRGAAHRTPRDARTLEGRVAGRLVPRCERCSLPRRAKPRNLRSRADNADTDRYR